MRYTVFIGTQYTLEQRLAQFRDELVFALTTTPPGSGLRAGGLQDSINLFDSMFPEITKKLEEEDSSDL